MPKILNETEINDILTKFDLGRHQNGNPLQITEIAEYCTNNIMHTYLNGPDDLKQYLKLALFGHLDTIEKFYVNGLQPLFDATSDLPNKNKEELAIKIYNLQLAIDMIEQIKNAIHRDLLNDILPTLNISIKEALDPYTIDLKSKLEADIASYEEIIIINLKTTDINSSSDRNTIINTCLKNAIKMEREIIQEEAKQETLGEKLENIVNAFFKIQDAKNGITVTVDSIEEAKEIVEQGGMAEVANHVSINDQNTCHNIAKTDHNAYRSIINRHYA